MRVRRLGGREIVFNVEVVGAMIVLLCDCGVTGGMRIGCIFIFSRRFGCIVAVLSRCNCDAFCLRC